MKHTSAFMKVLLLALCVVLALSFTACGNNEAVENLQQEVTQNKDKINETVGKLDDLTNNSESKATVAALRALVEEVKATADGAATAAKLEELANSLTATATDAAATAAALAETKTALEALIADGDDALTANVATVLAKVEDLADDAATKVELEETATAIDAVVADVVELLALLEENATVDADNKAAAEDAIAAINAKLDGSIRDTLNNLDAAITSNSAVDAETKALLEAAIAAVNEKLDGSIRDTLNNLDAAITSNSAVDAATKAAFEAAIADLVATVEANEDTFDAAVAEINATIATLATKAELGEVKHWVGDLVVALEERINNKIAALNANYAALAADLADAEASIRAELDAIKTKLDAFGNPVFVDDYKAATELLMNASSEYSLKAFRDLYEEYADAEAMYMADQYKVFMASLDVIEFYLIRATSVAEIEQLFDVKIAALVDEIEEYAWRDNFPALLESLKGTLTPDTDIEWVADIYDALPAEVQDANLDEYTNLFDAKAILDMAAIAADALDEAIAELAAETVIYLETAPYVEALCDLLDAIQAETFDDTELDLPEVYAYFLTDMNATDLLAEHDALLGMIARIAELDEAFAAMPEIIDVIADYDIARPLYTDFDAINANLAEVEAWVAEFALESENALAMINAAGVYEEFANLEDAWYYADAMVSLYNYYVAGFVSGEFEGLNETINALIAENEAKTLVLSKHEAAADAVLEALTGLVTDVAGVYQYDASIDANLEAMITADLDKFVAVEERIFGLNALKVYIPTLIAEVADLDANALDFADYDRINNFRTKLDAAYEVYEITVDDVNYVELATEAEARYTELKEGYNKLTAEVREVYLNAMGKLEAYTVKMPLDAGNVLIEVVNALRHIVVDMGLTKVDLYLGEDDAGTEANIAELYATFIDLAVAYGKDAEEAEEDAAELSGIIAGLGVATDLNNYEAITKAYADLLTWFEDYTEAELTEEAMLKALDAIKAINKFDDDVNTVDYYVFLSIADFEALYALNAEAIATYEAAAEASEEVLEIITDDAVNAAWNIHSDFKAAYEAFLAFVDEFYAGSLTADDVDFFGVLAAMEDGKEYYDAYVAAVDVVEDYAELVNDLIAALPVGAIAMEDGQYWLDYLDANIAVIGEFFEATNCEFGCAECVEEYLDATLVDVVRVYARAYMAAAYYEVYVLADAVNQTKIEVAKTLYDNMMNTAKSEAAIELVLTTALNKLGDYTI